MLNRRGFVIWAAGLVLLGVRAPWMHALAGTPITIYKSKTCGCCSKWVDHVTAAGFAASVHDEEDMDGLKDELSVPGPLRSCHTALVDGYLIEGHVPASDIRRLLAERPKTAGLAVPGMPAGSPGMAEPGKEGDYKVVAFQLNGSTTPFASH